MITPRPLIAISIAVIVAFATTGSVSAAESKTGDQITVRASQQISDDLYVFGRDVVIAGTVNGDLIGAADTVSVTGTVNGSINIAVRAFNLSGSVANAVRVTGESVTVSGTIGGDLVVAANTVEVTSSGAVEGDVLIGSGNLTVAGPIGGDIRGSAGDMSIGDRIAGDVRVSADVVELTGRSRIAGDLRYASNREATLESGSRVGGQIVRTSSLHLAGGPDLWSALTSQLMRLLLGLVTGFVLVLLLPRPAVTVADAIRLRFPATVISGMLGVVLWPVLALLLAATVVGIPIALIGTAVLLCAAYLSQIFVGLAIGRIILPGGWSVESRGFNILAMAIGMILIAGARAIPAPYISAIIAAITALLGFGAFIVSTRTGVSTAP